MLCCLRIWLNRSILGGSIIEFPFGSRDALKCCLHRKLKDFGTELCCLLLFSSFFLQSHICHAVRTLSSVQQTVNYRLYAASVLCVRVCDTDTVFVCVIVHLTKVMTKICGYWCYFLQRKAATHIDLRPLGSNTNTLQPPAPHFGTGQTSGGECVHV